MKTFPPFLKTFVHAAALVFGAFWLVATSAATGPAQDCFTGLANPTKIAVVLGTPLVDDPPRLGAEPTCGGIDGLVAGTTLGFHMSQGPRPQDVGAGACWSYDTQAIDGISDVQLIVRQTISQSLTQVDGTYTSPAAPACQGWWTLKLAPGRTDPGHPVSPLDAAAGGWFVTRDISFDELQACGAAPPGSGPGGCSDVFPVVSISEVAP